MGPQRRRHGEPTAAAAAAAAQPQLVPLPLPPQEQRRLRSSGCLRTSFTCLVSVVVALALLLLLSHGGSPSAVSTSVSFAMMRLFRDLARIKARRRRFGQQGALMPVLMGREEPLPLADASLGLALTPDELAEFDGRPLGDSGEKARLFLAVQGRIYDVTAGWSFYGPGSKYHKLVGKDATRAFCTGCLDPACLISNVEGLTSTQLQEAQRWIELYEHHDKYKLVGAVRQPSVAELADDSDEDTAEQRQQSVSDVERARSAWDSEQLEAAMASERRKQWKPFKLR